MPRQNLRLDFHRRACVRRQEGEKQPRGFTSRGKGIELCADIGEESSYHGGIDKDNSNLED